MTRKRKTTRLSNKSRHLRVQCECIRCVFYESEITSGRDVKSSAEPAQKFPDANPDDDPIYASWVRTAAGRVTTSRDFNSLRRVAGRIFGLRRGEEGSACWYWRRHMIKIQWDRAGTIFVISHLERDGLSIALAFTRWLLLYGGASRCGARFYFVYMGRT